jgi:transposase InsO family protein
VDLTLHALLRIHTKRFKKRVTLFPSKEKGGSEMGKHFDQRQKLVIVKKAVEVGFKEAAKMGGVHYTTVYEWQREVEVLGEEGFLKYDAPRPGRGMKEITEDQEKAIVRTWEANPGYGPGQVRNQLRREGVTISIRTVRRVMEANGYQGREKKSVKEACRRFEASRPLELAQMDILEVYINKMKVYLIILIDDFSRFILGFRVLDETSIDSVIGLVREAIERYGKMEEILTDRGFVFYSWRGANRFERYLEHERIDHIHARPHHPQTLGKVEALNRRIKSELFGPQHFSTVQEALWAMGQWVEHYNHRRPHQGLGGFLVPAERFHGLSEKVLDDLARGDKVEDVMGGVDRSLVNLVLGYDGTVKLYVLGRALVVKGESDGGDVHAGRSSGYDSSPSNSTGEGASR